MEILLVEDSPGDVRLIREAFREHKIGNELHVVPNGVEGLAFLLREGRHAAAPRPDLVLVELHLSREMLREMARSPGLRAIPVVVVAASPAEADACRALPLGVAGILSKPVDFRQLARIVQEITDLWITIVTVQPELLPPRAGPAR